MACARPMLHMFHVPRLFARSLVAAACTAIIAIAGCGDRGASPSSPDHDGPGANEAGLDRASERATDDPVRPTTVARVVSLSPAISETMARLQLDDLIVGRTPWCTAVDSSLPIVGDLMEVAGERLIEARPTIILVQPPRSGIESGLRTLASRHRWTIASWHIDGIDDILRVIDEVPGHVLPPGARLDETTERAAQLKAEIEDALQPDPRVARAGRVLLLFGADPPMAFGAGSYLGEVLERLGGTNAVTQRGFPQLTLEDLVRMAPETIILVGGAARGDAAVALLRRLALPADETRLLRFDEPAALVPGPSVGRVASRLRERLLEATPATAQSGTPGKSGANDAEARR